MNETVSSDEEGNSDQQENKLAANYALNGTIEDKEEASRPKDSVLESLSTSSLTNNISRHKGHVIIPLSKNRTSNVPNLTETLDTRIEPISENLNASLCFLNDEEDEDPVSTRHQTWSFTAAAMKNREKASCEGWNESSSEDEDDFDQFIEDRTSFHSTQNFDESNCIEYGKKYIDQDLRHDHWQPFPFVSESQKTNDLFCSSETGKFFCYIQLC